ncbi:MAG: hypothetical protein GY841_06445 [FCB group bacterium]|nr:hypothetical protein [FCB group bacterium]
MKLSICILSAVVCFLIGFISSKYVNKESTDKIFHLREQISLFQDGNKVGELYPGAVLSDAGSMDEGFLKAILLMNYYEKPDSLKYYIIKNSNHINPQMPCWNSKDVQPINSKD